MAQPPGTVAYAECLSLNRQPSEAGRNRGTLSSRCQCLARTVSVLAKFGNADHVAQAMAGLSDNMGSVQPGGRGQGDAAIALYQKSREIMPHPDNRAVQQLARLNR